MRKVFEGVTQRLQEFIGQQDELGLIVRCSDAESTLVLQLLETIEEGSTSELFWIFSDTFSNPTEYASAVFKAFESKHALIRLLQEGQGMPQWPAVPDAIREESTPAAIRLREMMVFARSLLPTLEGGFLVWGMFPLRIDDQTAYASLMRDVLEHEFPFPWCHHMRIIVRDVPKNTTLEATVAEVPHIAWYEPDLSTQALQEALEDEMADENLPLDERVQGVLLSAATDYSNKRYDQSMEKYQTALRYYSAVNNPTLKATALNGLGEVHQAQGQKAEANTCYEAAVVSATEEEPAAVPVLLNAVWNLANSRLEERRGEEAEGYYDVAQKLATSQRNSEMKIMAIEKLGEAQYQQQKVPEALASWTAGETLAEKLEQPELRKSILEHLRHHYDAVGDRSKLQELERKRGEIEGE